VGDLVDLPHTPFADAPNDAVRLVEDLARLESSATHAGEMIHPGVEVPAGRFRTDTGP
jgi:hypothetical protein